MPKEKQTRKKKPNRETWVNKTHFLLGYDVQIHLPTSREAHGLHCPGFLLLQWVVMRNSLVRQEAPGSTAKTETFVEVIYTL